MALLKSVTDALELKLEGKQDLVSLPKQTMRQAVCVFFYGKPAEDYRRSIQRGTAKGWGGAANEVRYFLLTEPNLVSLQFYSREKDSFEPISVPDLLDVFDEMQKANTAGFFRHGSPSISTYCLLDSSVFDSSDDLATWYNFIQQLKEVADDIVMSKTLMLLLREGRRYRPLAKQVRKILLEQDRISHATPNSSVYNSVFVLSTLAHGRDDQMGAYPLPTTSDGRFFQDYPLFADLILLSNTEESPWRLLFPSGAHTEERIAFFSAAYRCNKKPIEQIVLLSLYKAMEYIKGVKDRQAANLVLQEKLSVLVNAWVDDIVAQLYAKGLPSSDFLRLLPGEPQEFETFEQRVQGSAGVLEKFFERYFQSALDQHVSMCAASLQDKYVCSLREELTFPAFAKITSEDDCAIALKLIANTMEYRTLPPEDGIKQLLHLRTLETIAPYSEKALQEVFTQAKQCEVAFNSLFADVVAAYSSQNTELCKSIEAQYAGTVDNYLARSAKIPTKITQLMQIAPSKDHLLFEVQTLVGEMFSSESIFQIDYVNEIQKSEDDKVQTFVQELKEHIESDVHFNSRRNTPPPVLQAYFLDTMEGESRLLTLLKEERASGPPITFFDSPHSNMVEALWVYGYPQIHLEEERRQI
jgi:hypothetical protein